MRLLHKTNPDLDFSELMTDSSKLWNNWFRSTEGTATVIVDGATEQTMIRESLFGMQAIPLTNVSNGLYNTSYKYTFERLNATYRTSSATLGASSDFPSKTPKSWHADMAIQMGAVALSGGGLYGTPVAGTFAISTGTGTLLYGAARMTGDASVQAFLDFYKPFMQSAANNHQKHAGTNLVRLTQNNIGVEL
jgi:hypothetical protein